MYNPPLILIADDEPDTLDLLTRICQRAKYQTLTASDGNEAVHLAQSTLPDLILMDVQMPGMTGLQAVENLRQDPLTRHIPIIVITATATKPEQIALGIDLGADDYMPKPFNYHELLARIRAKLRNKELEEDLHRRTEELEMLVRLGITLSYPLSLREHAENILPFLSREFEASHSLCYIYSAESYPSVSLCYDSQKAEFIPLTVNKKPLFDPSIYFLNPQQCTELFQTQGLNSALLANLTHQGEAIGIIALAHPKTNFFDESKRRVMQAVGHHLTLSIRNAHLYESLRHYNNELELRVAERSAELQKAQSHLLRSEKLASLGRLAGEIAHEVNNPLQPIMTCLESAIEDLESHRLPDPQDLEIAVHEVKRLARIVTRLMDFARPDRKEIHAVNLHHVIDEVLALTEKKLKSKQIEVITELQDCPSISANGDQLKQVILNMAINAVDAMSDQERGTLFLRLWTAQNSVYITLQDTGKGIPPELMNQIFEPFFSTKEYGSGLGLAISYSIIEAHGGSVQVSSEINQGTTFTIRLPI